MFDSDDVRKRCKDVYDNQLARQRKRIQAKVGKKVKLELPRAQVMPYTFQEFFDWVWKKYGVGVHRCPWCGAPIDFLSMQFDHREPLEHNGSVSLDNLEGVCERCNSLKGSQSPAEFTNLLAFLETISPSHRKYLEQRIRAGAAANRMRWYRPDKKGATPPKPLAIQTRLDQI